MALFNQEQLNYFVHHTVLPPKSPQHDDWSVGNGNALLSMTIDTLRKFERLVGRQRPSDASHAGSVAFSIANLLSHRDPSGNISEAQLVASLRRMTDDSTGQQGKEYLPIELPAQNAALIIHRDCHDVIFEAFELSPTNSSVMTTKGRLRRSFPTLACRVSVDRLSENGCIEAISQVIAKQSAQVAPGFQAQATKKGQQHAELRDTTHPGMVTDYLMNILTAIGSSTGSFDAGIWKNTREEILWSNAKYPWRRSALWLLARVTMQLQFTRVATNGLYKLFMGFFFAQLLVLAKERRVTLSDETLYIMSAKAARRTRKLEIYSSHPSFQVCKTSITESLKDTHEILLKAWDAVNSDSRWNIDTSKLKLLNPSMNLSVDLKELDAFIAKISSREEKPCTSTFQPSIAYPTFSLDDIPTHLINNGDRVYFELAAAETWVEHQLEQWLERHRHEHSTCRVLLRCMESYHSVAKVVYDQIPSSISLMYLCLVELWVACDMSACHVHPLLRDYDPEIQLAPLENLSLPRKSHLQRLVEVERYVKLRRQKAKQTKLSVIRNFGHLSSFAVQFFDRSIEQQQLMSRIKTDAEIKRQEKCKELKQKQNQYQRLMNQYDESACEYHEVVVDNYHGYTESQHSRYCRKCALKNEAANIGIDIYEWPLPSEISLAKATIFELRIPEAFSSWRDATIYLAMNVLGSVWTATENPRARYTLTGHRDLSSSHRIPSSQRIYLLSQIKPHIATHRRTKNAITSLTEDDVCLKSGLQYVYFDSSKDCFTTTLSFTDAVHDSCIYKLPPRSSQLQRYVRPDSGNLPPNKVIATLSDSPFHMSLDEYKAFGSIPHGLHVTYLAILSQLAIPTVDFSNAETHCLMLQTIHRTGPSNKDGTAERETHRIILDQNFGEALVKALDVALRRITENWESWRTLAICVQLTLRILGFTVCDGVKRSCLELLKDARQICSTWLNDIKQRLQGTADHNQRMELYSRATEISLLCASTFDVDEVHIKDVFASVSHISALLQSSITVQENLDTVSARTEHRVLHQAMLQSWKSIMYRLPTLMNSGLFQNLNDGINDAVVTSWHEFRPAGRWAQLNRPYQQWVCAKVQNSTMEVHFNLVTAELLVNGLPLDRLPQKYVQHEMYERLFQNTTIEVMPTTEPAMELAAKNSFQNHRLFFGMEGRDLLIVARNGTTNYDLIPRRLFRDQFPQAFVNDYVHWYNRQTGKVEFRPRSSPWETSSRCWHLKRNGRFWHLDNGSSILLGSNSATSSVLATMLSPLEKGTHIHTMFHPSSQRVTVELPRLDLAFFFEVGIPVLHSKQYRGMVVDPDQRLFALNGLHNKLVLSNELNPKDRLLLLPEGSETVSKNLQVAVHIGPDTTKTIHAYPIDYVMGRITDNGSLQSKLWLAYMHALTAHCLPDPYTGYTGTESSLSILRSAAVLSFKSLTKENMDLLRKFSELTPLRRHYPRNLNVMQEVIWNGSLPSLSQSAGFFSAVDDIVNRSRALRLFQPRCIEVDLPRLTEMNRHLLERDLIRSSSFHVGEFGAEQFRTELDKLYQSRIRTSDTERGSRAFRAASLILRTEVGLSSNTVVSELKRSLIKLLEQSGVKGPGTLLGPQTLRYDAKWLGDPSSFLAELWCGLHLSLAKTPPIHNPFSIAVWLSTAAFAPVAQMGLIQTLAAMYRHKELGTIDIPRFSKLCLSKGYKPTSGSTERLVSALKPLNECPEQDITKQLNESVRHWKSRRQDTFETNRSNARRAFARAIEAQWPCESPVQPSLPVAERYINTRKAMEAIKLEYKALHDNLLFGQYLDKVCVAVAHQRMIAISVPQVHTVDAIKPSYWCGPRNATPDEIFALSAPSSAAPHGRRLPQAPKAIELPHEDRKVNTPESGTNLERLCGSLSHIAKSACEQDYVSTFRNSCEKHAMQQSGTVHCITLDDNSDHLLRSYVSDCERYYTALNLALNNLVKSSPDIGNSLHHGPRITASFWLQQLNQDRHQKLSNEWKEVIVRYGLAVTELRRAYRLLSLSCHKLDLAEELANRGHENWNPADFPETLLLEAESGIIVRKVQEEIAHKMRSPPKEQNSVMQLNMGEGKSSVIVPIVAAALADSTRLVRVIVGKPQSKQMYQMLVSKLGGLLNRLVYHMPFSRDLRPSPAQAEFILQMCKDCMKGRGILLLQPEHILSFKLMGIESLIDGNTNVGRPLLRTQEYFESNSRDIVDESDENFSVKFELVYTMGAQRPVQQSPDRWNTIHSVLGLVSHYAARVKKEIPEAIEFDDRWRHEGRYPRVRTLSPMAENKLFDLIADHICNIAFPGLPINRQPENMREQIRQYIRHSDLSATEIDAVENGPFWAESTKDTVMLMRGLIAGGVLRFVLSSKRWRVNYGLDPHRSPETKLAVPYRSKDCPSPRSEFSHPDVVIALTSLTYYYGGLDDDNLFRTLEHLNNSDQADIEYGNWVRTADTLPEAFRSLSGINTKDRHQCVKRVFPSLRFLKGAIDYFLSHIVFPKEMKEFPNKLSASGWDLGQSKTLPLTGFSGTNDSHHVLPLDVHHLDLPSQQHTNALVLAHLMQKENTVELLSHKPANTSDAQHLLDVVGGMDIQTRVILDVGAQILELNNFQVAEKWLSMNNYDVEDTKAVIFFDENEELSVLDRAGKIEPLQTSAFAKQLDSCLVYLDEAHTRGTDLRLPRHYRAAVTLGASLTKDRLVQACMRMRKLGKGQSVVFCIPKEIQTKIMDCRSISSAQAIGVIDVLVWAISETWADLRRSMPLWATQGNRYEMHRDLLSVEASQSEAEKYLEDEAQSIERRYRPRRAEEETFMHWDMSNKNVEKILARCRAFGATNFTSATLHEEQERELSPEIEEERQVERPISLDPEQHILHKDLVHLVETGELTSTSKAVIPAFVAFVSTSAAPCFDLLKFPKDLMVTQDYARTVRKPPGRAAQSYVSDSYQRPVQWVLSVPSKSSRPTGRLLILSPFEADKLFERIRIHKKVTLHLYAPRVNLSYQPLDGLQLYTVGRHFDVATMPRSLIVQLNLFAGQLYFSSYAEYTEFCNHIGVAAGACSPGETQQADGFVIPPRGLWGFGQSPVAFLKSMIVKVRRHGDSADKTHLGRVLNGEMLELRDFE